MELPYDDLMIDVKTSEAWSIQNKNRKGKLVKKGQKLRSGTSKKYSDPIQFVLKHDSILSNRTSDTMLPKVGKLPLSAPFQNIPLSSLDKLIEGLVKHIEFQIEIILDKRGNFQEANH